MFRLVVEDVFGIKGRGTVVTGTIAGGRARVGLPVVITASGREPIRSTITGVEMGGPIDRPPTAFLLRGVEKADVPIGAVINEVPPAES